MKQKLWTNTNLLRAAAVVLVILAYPYQIKAFAKYQLPVQSKYSLLDEVPPAVLHAAPAQSGPLTNSAASENPRIISSNQDGVVLELLTSEFSISSSTTGQQTCHYPVIKDYPESEIAGSPRLPIKGSLVGIPLSGEPLLTIIEVETVELADHYVICPTLQPIMEFLMPDQASTLGEVSIKDPEVYLQNQLVPSRSAEFIGTAMIRSQRVAQLRFHPFQYNPVTGKLSINKRIKIKIGFLNTSKIEPNYPNQLDEGVYESSLRENVLNYQQAVNWRTPQNIAKSPAMFQSSALGTVADQYRITTKASGIYKITYESMLASGAVLVDVDPMTFQISNQAGEVAIQVIGYQDGSFDSGDFILFYAEAINTKYSETNVYWLTWGGSVGKRMTLSDSTPIGTQPQASFLTTKKAETNAIYVSNLADSFADHWYWSLVNAQSAPATSSFSIDLGEIDSSQSFGRLRFLLKGYRAAPFHHSRVYLNDHLVDEGYWSATAERLINIQVPMEYLVSGVNTLKVELPRDAGITLDQVLMNWFELDYWKMFQTFDENLEFTTAPLTNQDYRIAGFINPEIYLFDITNPSDPIRQFNHQISQSGETNTILFHADHATEHRYLAVSSSNLKLPESIDKKNDADLKSPANAADYLLITHHEFLDQVQLLAEKRVSQGLRVEIIDVQSIYDEFSGGVLDPQAIRDFIAYTYEYWEKPAPTYVLLVGDGHYDPRNYLGTNEPIFIPAYLLPVDYYMGETASDNRYVTVSGTDNLPDLMIGRLPVKSQSEASALISKILTYEEGPANNDWNDDVLFVSDNPDAAGDFYNYSNQVLNNYLPAGYTASKVYYGSTHTTITGARDAIQQGLNQGKLIVNYVGHGTTNQWAVENLLDPASASSLLNKDKYAFFTSLACLTGQFHIPSPGSSDNSSLAEILVRLPESGAVASFASSGLGLASGQDYLNRGLFKAIFYDGHNRLGEAALQAKLFLTAQSSSYPDLVDNFILFGDPALKLNVVPADLSIALSVLPTAALYSGMPISYTLSFTNSGNALATHIQIENPLPVEISDPIVSSVGVQAVQLEDSRLSWAISDLDPGTAGKIVISGFIDPSASGEISSQASIETAVLEDDLSNNISGQVNTQILQPTNVILQNFSAVYLQNKVEINWETSSELNIVGFNLYKVIGSGPLEGDPINIDLIWSEKFGTPDGAVYRFTDSDVVHGQNYKYFIEIVDQLNGSEIIEGPTVYTFNLIYLPFLSR